MHRFAERWVQRLRPYAWLWPPTAFLSGVLSFFLVDRQQTLGAILALGLLFAWLLLLSENLIERFLAGRGYPTLASGVTAFIAQLIHQETLFFTLPFVLATTAWASGQALFTLLMIACALLSILDPLYFRLAERHRWLYFAFHAQCVFLVILVTLPIMFQLTTSESLILAILATVFFSLPSLVQLLRPKGPIRWLAMIGLAIMLGAAAWAGRAWVPPATLWLTGTALSPAFDTAARQPLGSMPLTVDALQRNGLYAYTSIRAPRGLRETIYHEWRHEGKLIDRIPLIIKGGRSQGYRSWSHKQRFPEDSAGSWRIDVMTDIGQRIGVVHFTVTESLDAAGSADGKINVPLGIPGLKVHKLLSGAS